MGADRIVRVRTGNKTGNGRVFSASGAVQEPRNW
jgi:hypothetical protein